MKCLKGQEAGANDEQKQQPQQIADSVLASLQSPARGVVRESALRGLARMLKFFEERWGERLERDRDLSLEPLLNAKCTSGECMDA